MFCPKCGKEINDDAVVCINCGVSVKEDNKAAPVESSNTFGWGLLGFCIPIVGLILFLIWKSEKPKTAKTAGIGALIGFGIGIVFAVIYSVIIGSLMGSMMY